jgi:hypothetical protein
VSTYHALLIGIDAYDGGGSLTGCVNDVDAIQRLLIDRLGVERGAIQRLVSPRFGVLHQEDVEGRVATLANLRGGLERMREVVQPGDRALIYYSGHGTHHVDGRGVAREALLPKDKEQGPHRRFLYDWELNQRISAIVEKAHRVTVVLDCCAAQGATRSQSSARHARDRCWPSPPGPAYDVHEAPERVRGLTSGLAALSRCQVIAACRDDERARESSGEGEAAYGELTRALLDVLSQISNEDLGTLRWGQIWRDLTARVRRANPWQTPWLAGSFGRAVFGDSGDDDDGDVGYSIEPVADGYRLDVGSLHGVTEGAELAVYGATPARFPSPGSLEDRSARCGMLLVRSAEAGSCIAVARSPFVLPQEARGRLVRPGPAARLRVRLAGPDEALSTWLLREAPIELDEQSPELELVRLADGAWALADDCFGAGLVPSEPSLVIVPPDRLRLLPAVLSHYLAYITPVRMAKACPDLPGGLQITLLNCNGHELRGAAAQDPQLPQAEGSHRAPYELRDGDRVCYLVENRADVALSVTLIDCAASGRVQILGEARMPAHTRRAFWYCLDGYEELGEPFVIRLRTGSIGVDRILAIGATRPDVSLRHLAVPRLFAEVLEPTREHNGSRKGVSAPEQWTSASTVVRISR